MDIRRLSGALAVAAALTLSACGEQHDAERLVSDFMDDHLENPSALSDVKFEKVDSTKLLTEKTIADLRLHANEGDIFRKDITYKRDDVGRKLYLLRVRYNIDDSAYISTFYISEDMESVVAFKTY